MRAVVARENRLVVEEAPEPVAREGQTIVDVRASALNRADLLQARGLYPPPPGESEIIGLEAAGVDRETGARVCFLLGSGGLAERVAVDRRRLLVLPDAMSFEQAAAVPEVWLTAYLNLFIEGGLRAGERVLIHAAASGVGTAAVQLAKRRGAYVIGTVRSQSKIDRVLALGADECVVGSAADVDVILDVLGAGALAENVAALRVGGRLVCIGLLQGATAELSLGAVLMKRLRIIGSTLRSRSDDEKAALTSAFRADAWPAFASGRLAPVIDRVLAMHDAQAALERLASNETIGKVVLAW